MILMYYWNPARLKELKQRGLKLTSYRYDPKMREQTIEEIEASEQANKRASEQAGGRVGPELSSAQPEVEKK